MDKIKEYFKKIFKTESAIKRIPFYLFLICILLFVLIFKLYKTNIFLQKISENNTNSFEINNAEISTVLTSEESIENILPIFVEDESTEKSSNSEPSSYISTTEEITQSSTAKVNDSSTTTKAQDSSKKTTYIINKNSKKIHKETCSSGKNMKEENKKVVTLTKSELDEYLNNGYSLCSRCGGQ